MSDAKVIIDLCSSDEEGEEDIGDENNCEEEWLEEEEEEEDWSFSEDDIDRSHDDATESDVESDEDDEIGGKCDGYDKVTRLLKAGSDLKSLNLIECKAYLRKHGLRLSGTKAVCIERIVEHWRLRDGSGEAVYPRSSFAINCKGDVCKGDIVLFTQKIHQKCENMKRSGKIMGKRTVAGQVIKESYGTAKQQHTFTIEVLWCKGIQKLPPLYPLLVKGRNLYRLTTLRQRWANEGDRVKVLSEKHSRGAAARKVMRKRKIKSGYVLKDGRLQKPGNVKKPCQVKMGKNEKSENLNQRFRQDIPANHSLVDFPNRNSSQGHKNPTQLRNMNPSFQSHSHAPSSYGPFNVPHSHLPRPNIPPSHSYAYQTQPNQSNQRPPLAFYNKNPTFNALQGQASINPHADIHAMPVTHQSHHTHNASLSSGYNFGVRELDHLSDIMIKHRREGDTYRQSEDSRRPYKNHHTYHSNKVHHRREGDTHRPNHW